MRVYDFGYLAGNVLFSVILLGNNFLKTVRAMLLGNVGHSHLHFSSFLLKLELVNLWKLFDLRDLIELVG
jgi:hypothetical protein